MSEEEKNRIDFSKDKKVQIKRVLIESMLYHGFNIKEASKKLKIRSE